MKLLYINLFYQNHYEMGVPLKIKISFIKTKEPLSFKELVMGQNELERRGRRTMTAELSE